MSTVAEESTLQDVAPGTVVWVRDAEWLVTQVTPTQDGLLVTCQGLPELVAGTTAQFFEDLDDIEVSDPRKTQVVADDSPGYRDARLWLEAALRKTPLPVDDQSLSVIDGVLADSLGKRVEVYSLPYSRINLWSSEKAGGVFDFNSELEMWTRAGQIKIKLDKKIDIRRLDQLIAWGVLNSGA